MNDVSLNVTNLADGTTVLQPLLSTTSAWQFSPCGGEFVLAAMNGDGSAQDVTLYSSFDGRVLGHAQTPVITVTVSATDGAVVVSDSAGTSETLWNENRECARSQTRVPMAIYGGDTTPSLGDITLDRPAPDVGSTFALTSSDPAHLSVPATVTVPAGQTSAMFPITVTLPDADVDVTLTMTPTNFVPSPYLWVTVTWQVVVAAGWADSLDLFGPAVGDASNTVEGELTLADPALPDGGVVVPLTSDNPALVVPATVTVPKGQTVAYFSATTTSVDDPVTATVTAALPNDEALTTTDTVEVDPHVPSALTASSMPGGHALPSEDVTLDATVQVSPSGPDWASGYSDETPTGTITVADGDAEIATADVEQAGDDEGVADASLDIGKLAAGEHDLTVSYSGDATYAPSRETVTIEVGAGLTWIGGAGGDGLFSDPANWDGDRAPTDDDLLVIRSDDALTVHDDMPGLALDGVHLYGPVTLDGRPITLDGGIVGSGDPGTVATVDNDLVLSSGDHPLTASDLLFLSGAISGPGGVSVATSHGAFVVLDSSSANTYTGVTRVAAGASLLVGNGASLGASGDGQGTRVSGTLCVARGVTTAEPIESDDGAIASCDSPGDLAAGDFDDGGFPAQGHAQPYTATLTGPVDEVGGVAFGQYACYVGDSYAAEYLADLGLDVALDVDGAVSGAGDVPVGCMVGDGGYSGTVTFGGSAPNTYDGVTSTDRSTLALAKPDGVIALPGDLHDVDKGTLALLADDQIAHDADVDAGTIDLGAHQVSVNDVSTGEIDATVDSDGSSGVLHAATGAEVDDDVVVSVAGDPAVGSSIVVLDNESGDPIGNCPDGDAAGGGAVTSYKVDCTGGDGNDLAVRAMWTSKISVVEAPPDGVDTGGSPSFTVTVGAPPGGTTPTGQVTLTACTVYSCADYYPNRVTTYQTTPQLVGGTATFALPDTSFLNNGAWLRFSYLGDSLHAAADSPMTQYLTWPAPGAGATVPGAPTIDADNSYFCDSHTACLGWDAPADAGGTGIVAYHITVTPEGGTPSTIDTAIGQQHPEDSGYDIDGLLPDTAYTFTVAAVNHSGVGPASAPFTMTSPPPGDVPGTPTDVTATAGLGEATVDWTAPSDDGGQPIDDYDIVVDDANGDYVTDVWTADAATHVTVTGLTPGQAYTFIVTAINVIGLGDDSAPTAPVTPTALPSGATVPAAPTDVTATAGAGSVTVSWNAPADDGGLPIASYEVTFTADGQSWSPLVTSGADTSVTITNVPDGTYTLTVAAANGAGAGPDSAASDPVTVTATGPGEAPGAPTDVRASAGGGQAFVTWTPPGDDGGAPIQRYVVTPYIGDGAQAPVTTAGPVTSMTVSGLSANVPYSFTVEAVNANGAGPASAHSAVATPTPPDAVTGVPTAPLDLSDQVSGQQVTLSWSPPADDGGSRVTGYLVEESEYITGDLGPWQDKVLVKGGPTRSWVAPVDDVPFTVTSEPITIPWTRGAYMYTVRALNANGDGPASDKVYAAAVWVLPPGYPTGGGSDLPPCSSVDPGTPCQGPPGVWPPTGTGTGTGPTGIDNTPGGTADLNGGGFAPGEPVKGELHSTVVDLGTSVAGADGSVDALVTIPADIPPGQHEFTLTGETSGHVVTVPVTITQPLTVGDVTSSSATVSWPAPRWGNVTGFTVGVDGTQVARLAASVTSYGLTGLTPAVAHTVTVTAQGDDGPLGSMAIVVDTLSALTATPSQGAVALTWSASSDPSVTGYRVTRSTGGGAFTTVADVDAATTSYVDNGLPASTTYDYRVLALHADGSTASWSDVVSATTPDLAVTAVVVRPSTGLGGGDVAYGSGLEIELDGDAGRTATAAVEGETADGTTVSRTVSLTESTPGTYTGTLTLDADLATIDSVTGTLSDGAHSVSAAASGTPLTQGGRLAIDIAAGNVAIEGARLELIDAAEGIDDVRPIDVPGSADIAVDTGTWTVRLVMPDGDVLAESDGVEVGVAAVTPVSLTPVRHASLAVDLTAPDGQAPGGYTVTVTDAAGDVLGSSDVASGDPTAAFDGLVAGADVTVTATLDDPTRALVSTLSGSLTLAGGANQVGLDEQALPTGQVTGTVTPATARVVVDEKVDGRSWEFTAIPDADGSYTVDVLAGTAHVTLSADSYQPASVDIDVPAGETASVNPVTLVPVTVPVTLRATASPSAPVVGDDITVSVTMSPAVDGATVDVREGSTALGSATVGSDGQARIVLSRLAAGTHDLTVSYAGDAAHQPASTSVSVSIAAAAGTATRLRIELPRTLADLLRLLFGQYDLRVVLTTDHGTPIAGQHVVVSTWHGQLCAATTDGSGVVSCRVPGYLAGDVLAGEVYASFAGSAGYLGSSAGFQPPAPPTHGHGGSGHGGSGHSGPGHGGPGHGGFGGFGGFAGWLW